MFKLSIALILVTILANFTSAQDITTQKLYPSKNLDIRQNERLEIGVSFAESTKINEQINNFLDQKKENALNPFLEWELKVYARFTYKGDWYLDSSFIWDQDAFYYENYSSYQRSIIPRNREYYSENEYEYVGGYDKLEDNPFNFRVRWSPPIQGNYSYQIIVEVNGEVAFSSSTKDFYVIRNENSRMGIAADNRNFTKGNQIFKPVGTNVKWPNTAVNENPEFASKLKLQEEYRAGSPPPQTYAGWKTRLKSIGNNGGNYVRWINHASTFEIEYERLGDYSNRMNTAQEIDSSVWLAEEYGMNIHWTLMSQFYLTENIFYMGAWDWTEENGGSGYCYKTGLGLTSIWDFFSDEEAKKYYKQRLRYIMARWGYSTNIGILELMSEMDEIGKRYVPNAQNQLVAHDCYYDLSSENQGNVGDCVNDRVDEIPEQHFVQNLVGEWSAEIATYIKSQFFEAPLISANYAGAKGEFDGSYAAEDVDVLTRNNYSYRRFVDFNYEYYSTYHYAADLDARNNRTEYSDLNKPFMFSESGPIPLYECCRGVEAVRSLWKLSFSGLAGATDWVLIEDTTDYKSLDDLAYLFSNRDLEDWYSSSFKLLKSGDLKLNESYINALQSKDGKADAICLKNKDRTKAFGVITNRTYNFYSQRDSTLDNLPYENWDWNSFCAAAVNTPLNRSEKGKIPWSVLEKVGDDQYTLATDLRKATPINSKDSKVVVKGLKPKLYRIKYYTYTDTKKVISYSYDVGPNVNLEFPTIGNTEEDYMMAFDLEVVR